MRAPQEGLITGSAAATAAAAAAGAAATTGTATPGAAALHSALVWSLLQFLFIVAEDAAEQRRVGEILLVPDRGAVFQGVVIQGNGYIRHILHGSGRNAFRQ